MYIHNKLKQIQMGENEKWEKKKRKGMVGSIPDTGNASNQIRIKTKRLHKNYSS